MIKTKPGDLISIPYDIEFVNGKQKVIYRNAILLEHIGLFQSDYFGCSRILVVGEFRSSFCFTANIKKAKLISKNILQISET